MEESKRKIFYTIGEVAAMFRVNTSLIRFWEQEFDIIQPQRNKKGNRLFTRKDVDNFQIIYHLVKEKGYTLQGAKEQLRAKPVDAGTARMEIAGSLRQLKSMLLELRDLC